MQKIYYILQNSKSFFWRYNMVSLVNTLSAAKLNGGAFLATCTTNLRSLASKIQQFFLKILQTILPCLFKKAVAKPLSTKTAEPQLQPQPQRPMSRLEPTNSKPPSSPPSSQQNPLSQIRSDVFSPSQVQHIDRNYFNGAHPSDPASQAEFTPPLLARTLTSYCPVGRKPEPDRSKSQGLHPQSGFQLFSRQASNTSESDEQKSLHKETVHAEFSSNNNSSTRGSLLSPPPTKGALLFNAYSSFSGKQAPKDKQYLPIETDNVFSLLAGGSESGSAVGSPSASPRSVHSEKNKSLAPSDEE